MYLGAATNGCTALYENEGQQNPMQLRQSILGALQLDCGGNEKIVASTFRMGLLEDSKL